MVCKPTKAGMMTCLKADSDKIKVRVRMIRTIFQLLFLKRVNTNEFCKIQSPVNFFRKIAKNGVSLKGKIQNLVEFIGLTRLFCHFRILGGNFFEQFEHIFGSKRFFKEMNAIRGKATDCDFLGLVTRNKDHGIRYLIVL